MCVASGTALSAAFPRGAATFGLEVGAVVGPPAAGRAFAGETAAALSSGLETLTIGRSWNTWAETRTTKTAIAMPIKVTPERAPTR